MTLSQKDEPATVDASRRDFLRIGASAVVSVAAVACGHVSAPRGAPSTASSRVRDPAPSTLLFAAPALERVRVGFVGVGVQGMVHVANFLSLEGVDVKAICDVDESHARAAAALVSAAAQRPPTLYTRGPLDFKRMIAEEDLDLVVTATPWEWHVPVMLESVASGKHVATEVPAAYRVDDCWAIVEAAERHQRHCLMLENCCYNRRELLMLNLVRAGVFGDIEHAECGYNHDLRAVKFDMTSEGLWRRAHAMRRNGNLYPTHGLGPIAQCMNINRGNAFDYLVSMSGPSRGLQNWQREHLAADDPRRREQYVLGDVNLSLIRTQAGQTIVLTHNTNLPRPYSRINMIQGTRGLMQGWPARIYVEGRSQPADEWQELDSWFAEYEHPLWNAPAARNASTGHGGMDFLEAYRLIGCLRAGVPTDQNVYDAASWSCITELTERSVASRSQAVDIPDFTRGRWRDTPPVTMQPLDAA